MARSALTAAERERYHRQMLIPGWGEAGQRRLKEAVAFIAGAGGLGSPVAIYLAAAGVGTLRICDNGTAELSNLNRQVLHGDADLGRPKAESARDALQRINPEVRVVPLAETIRPDSIERLAGDALILVDCLDNLETRFVLNELCVRRGLPLVHGGIYGLSGQLTFLHPPETGCLACTFPEHQQREVFPVAGPTPGTIGALQAMETLKYLTGTGTLLKGRLLLWDGGEMSFQEVRLERDPACRICGAEAGGPPARG